jgi:glutamine amidotransferase/cyclase
MPGNHTGYSKSIDLYIYTEHFAGTDPKIIMAIPTVHLLDYVAGNVRSLVNAIEKLGFNVEWIKEPADISKAEV